MKKTNISIQNPMLNGVSVRFRTEVQSTESRINSGFFCFFSIIINDNKNAKGYRKGYKFEVKVLKRSYTLPALYIAKESKNGKKIPSIAPGKRWYVWFRFEGKMFKFKQGLNSFETITERKEVGKAMVNAYTQLLNRGWNPELNIYDKSKAQKLTLEEGLNLALKNKVNGLKQSTLIDYNHRLSKFLSYCKDEILLGISIDALTKKEFAGYLNFLSENGANNNSIANDKRAISALFGKLVQDFIIDINPLQGLKVATSQPKKNKAFTGPEIKTIIDYARIKDPYLINFIQFLVFALLRPTEVVRIKLSNIKDNIITIDTKTDDVTYIKVIEKLLPFIQNAISISQSKNDYLITSKNIPGQWPISEKSRYDHFNRRFKKIKDHLGFGQEYGLYSFRHSAIYALYTSFINEGKTERESILEMLPITRHRSEEALKKYLREIGADLPKDYGARFNFDL